MKKRFSLRVIGLSALVTLVVMQQRGAAQEEELPALEEGVEEESAQDEVLQEEDGDKADDAKQSEGGSDSEDSEDEEGELESLPLPEHEDVAESLLPESSSEEEEEAIGFGIVEGLIFDANSGKGLAGAIVSFKGYRIYAKTDETGRFRAEEVPAGFRELLVNKSGYELKSGEVEVKAGELVTIEIDVTESATETDSSEHMLDDYDFIEEYKEEEKTVLNLGETDSPGLVGGLSKAEFSKAAVSDAGDAVAKVAGANIIGGQFAVVRGLGDRYSNTTVNGALIPSADPSRKAVQLDLFPADLLQSVKIYKTLRPDRPGEFTGGLVEIETLSLPKERIIEISVGMDYSPRYDDASEYRGIRSGSLNFLGDNLDNPFKPFYRKSRFVELTDAFFDSGAGVSSEIVDPDRFGGNVSALYGDKWELGGESELGIVLSFTQDSGDNYRRRLRTRAQGVTLTPDNLGRVVPGRFDGKIVRENGNVTGVGANLVATDDIYSHGVDWGALGSVGWKINNDHTLKLTYFRNHSVETTVSRAIDLVTPDENLGQIEQVITGDFTANGQPFSFYLNPRTNEKEKRATRLKSG